jgi:RNA polymerase sigma factor (sigma-70 family)
VVQEVFARAFSEPARMNYDGLRCFRNYLFAIARNVIARELSRHASTTLCDDGDFDSVLRNTPTEPIERADEQILERQMLALADAFESSLSHFDRGLFKLRFREQLTQEETARRIKLTRGKVRTYERRIRRRLAQFLEKHRVSGMRPQDALQQLLACLMVFRIEGGRR